MQNSWEVVVIGGGAAGLWAGGTAAARGRRTVVLEKNHKLGVKILMSGGTRCNLTHDCDSQSIVNAFGDHGKFLYSPLARLAPHDVVSTIESYGVATKVESTGKVFPVSNRAIDVRDALVRRLISSGGTYRTDCPVQGLDYRNGSAEFVIHTPQGTLNAQHVILATGGKSYPGCGTTGEGYAWASQWGHTIAPTRPALTPLRSQQAARMDLSGMTLGDTQVSILDDVEKGHRDPRMTSRSSLLFTHFGLSGPGPMNVSRAFGDPSRGATGVQVDFLPERSEARLRELLSPLQQTGKIRTGTVIRDLLPRRLADVILAESGIEAERSLAELSHRHRDSLLRLLKAYPILVDGTCGYEKAEVTAGGVILDEVDSRTMQSRLVPGLYLIGEILDLDGPIGGYNFQAAFSTGHTAGMHA